jgi:YVTN family beta-propeller protein
MMPSRIPKVYGPIGHWTPPRRCLRSYSRCGGVAPAATETEWSVDTDSPHSLAESPRNLRFGCVQGRRPASSHVGWGMNASVPNGFPVAALRRRSLLPTGLLVLALGACHSTTNPGPDGCPCPDAGPNPVVVNPTFTFESGPVRPVALSPDGSQLFVANTANGSLDVFAVAPGGLSFAASVYVGLEPVAVAARTNSEVWVVNQVSDSVSIVDVSTNPPHVARTLLVGDEPSDIVFGGDGGTRAFITTAHRGQQRTDPSLAQVPGAGDPQLTTPGVGRADVWVFDGTALGSTVGGTPLAIVSLFGDTPRALAVTPDGTTVYAAVFKSGNQTMATSSELPCDGFDSTDAGNPCTVLGVSVPGSPPGPATNYAGLAAPKVAMILKTDAAGTWRDVLGRDWTSATAFSLPDQDVFSIDTTSLTTRASFAHVGTTLFNLAVNPVSGVVYVSNTEARNDLRFEGPGTFAGRTLQGHLAEARITVLSPAGVAARSLNKHIDYSVLPAPPSTLQHSLSTPLQLAVSQDGQTLYVAAFGSSKVGVFPTASIENDSFNPVTQSTGYLSVSGGGPSGLALDGANNRLYVTTRFDNGLSVVDLASGVETAHLQLVNPEPAAVIAGRPFLYDATRTSSNGEASCASCHMFGDKDNLVWDLGNPDADPVVTPINIKLKAGAVTQQPPINGSGNAAALHPMKGPMSTQTLRGLINHGPMHWRGDRAVGFFGADTSAGPPYDSMLAFKNFIVAFNSLVGLGPAFPDADMQTFANFALDIVMPPNPVRALDNSLTPAQAAGRAFFLGCDGIDSFTRAAVQCADGQPPTSGGHLADGVPISNLGFTCQGCHVLNPAMGFFGTDGESSFESLPQTVKVPQLRNLYDKVGMFGAPPNLKTNPGNNGNTGPQVRGVGFEHDGSVDTLFRFLQALVFNAPANGISGFAGGDTQRQNVEQYLLAFDSDLAPIVGQQVTLRSDNTASVGPRIDLLIARASTPFTSKLLGANAMECDLIARVAVAGVAKTFLLLPGKVFGPGDGTASLSDSALRALAATAGQEVTYTCLPPGWATGAGKQ